MIDKEQLFLETKVRSEGNKEGLLHSTFEITFSYYCEIIIYSCIIHAMRKGAQVF